MYLPETLGILIVYDFIQPQITEADRRMSNTSEMKRIRKAYAHLETQTGKLVQSFDSAMVDKIESFSKMDKREPGVGTFGI